MAEPPVAPEAAQASHADSAEGVPPADPPQMRRAHRLPGYELSDSELESDSDSEEEETSDEDGESAHATEPAAKGEPDQEQTKKKKREKKPPGESKKEKDAKRAQRRLLRKQEPKGRNEVAQMSAHARTSEGEVPRAWRCTRV